MIKKNTETSLIRKLKSNNFEIYNSHNIAYSHHIQNATKDIIFYFEINYFQDLIFNLRNINDSSLILCNHSSFTTDNELSITNSPFIFDSIDTLIEWLNKMKDKSYYNQTMMKAYPPYEYHISEDNVQIPIKLETYTYKDWKKYISIIEAEKDNRINRNGFTEKEWLRYSKELQSLVEKISLISDIDILFYNKSTSYGYAYDLYYHSISPISESTINKLNEAQEDKCVYCISINDKSDINDIISDIQNIEEVSIVKKINYERIY